jgi:aspartate aminotransferase
MGTLQLSRRVRWLQPSPTLSLDSRIKELQSQGVPVINFTIGEPDFSTPKYIQKAAVEAMESGFTHYTPSSGIPDLRQAIARKLSEENRIKYDPAEIMVAVGTKHVLALALQALCQSGDEVIIPTPTWSTYVEQVKLAGAKPVLIALPPPFVLTAKAVESSLTRRTKVLILNSPCNPTGAMVPEKELRKIAALAREHNIFIISDEIYEKIIYGGQHVSIASFGKDIKDLTLTVNGFSKAYAMTGWRVGYGAGPKPLIAAMSALAGQTTSGTCSISQKAAVAALSGPQNDVKKMAAQFRQRREFLVKELSAVKGITVSPPQGAFYLFVNVQPLLGGKFATSLALTEALLSEAKVAVVPGEAFCAPGYFRLSFAASLPVLKQGAARIKQFIKEQSV